MCGFAGFVGGAALDERTLQQMASMIVHRGPDDSGIWIDQSAAVGLAHRRLSILDLSQEGHQPMVSPSGRFVMAFNGEIYNHKSLRTELTVEGARFSGHSDTEVLLSAIEQWGVRQALRRAAGMFAITLYDRSERRLSLIRDRMGEKPLYYGWQGNGQHRVFLFGSELKALRQHPSWQGGIDRDSVAQLLRYNYIPEPMTIHPEVKKLPPGGLLELQGDANGIWKECGVEQWWSFEEQVDVGRSSPFVGGDAEAVEALDRILREVVGEQSLADVPVGAFLSGGIDSASVVALMQSLSNQQMKSFTIGYEDADYDESANARRIAEHLGTDHSEWILGSQDVLGTIADLPTIYDEPFADVSQIPTMLVSRFARDKVTVSISGDGGDELFGGYNRHFWAPKVMHRIDPIPLWLRRATARSIKGVSPSVWSRLFEKVEFLLPDHYSVRQPGEKLHKIARLMGARSEQELYAQLVSIWEEPTPVIGGHSLDSVEFNGRLWQREGCFSERMMWLDSVTYLPDDILVKVDRAAMSASLEGRMPFLDHRVVEFALSLPPQMKIRDGKGKWVLRKMLDRYVPRAYMEQPKTGFGLPIHQWLRGPLKEWAEELLSEQRLRAEGFFDVDRVRTVWQRHLSGEQNNQYLLWGVLMFQSWKNDHLEGMR